MGQQRELYQKEMENANPPRRSRRPAWLVGALVVVLLAAVGAYVLWFRSESPPYVTVQRGYIRGTVIATGEVVSERQTQLSSRVTGQVTSVAVEPGDEVVTGTLLLTIEAESLRYRVEHARLQLEIARLRLDQASERARAEAVARARADLNLAQARLEELIPQVTCVDGTQASGAHYRICMPDILPWNGDLVVFAHGYVAPNKAVGIPEEQLYLPDGSYIPDVLAVLGYGFATTSYSTNGLAIREGLPDLIDVVDIFRQAHPGLERVFLVGASEGGVLTTLAVEQHPDVFDGGLALCAPVGDFRAQIDHVGDLRVLFDYFFPGLIPGSPVSIPPGLVDNWDAHYSNTVLPALRDPSNAFSVTQLLSVTQAAYDPLSPTTAISTVGELLWFNVVGTNDATSKLGGQPFDNRDRVYSGSADDAALNAAVQRFSADQAALDEIAAHYQTAGRPLVPLVTQHTTLDPVAPYWHETLYRAKVVAQGMTPRHDNLVVERYGHCVFEKADVLKGLLLAGPRESEVLILEAELRSAELSLEEAQADVEKASVTAPFAGTVVAVRVERGELVGLYVPLVTIADLDALQIRARIDEIDVGQVAPGQVVTITLDSFPGRPQSGYVEEIAPAVTVDRGSPFYLSTISFAQPPTLSVRLGMAVSLEIVTVEKGGLLVPRQAVEHVGSGFYVTVLHGNQRERVRVVLGASDALHYEVLSGLSEGDKVLLP
jgi:multidrug efflux pump subunit AcrA (membrane-fusion protein)